MINPEMSDWWSRRRITSIKYDGKSLNGAGVSMQVITKAFKEDEFTWFSIVYGEFNDNLILVAMSNESSDKFTKVKYDALERKRLFFGQILKNEYRITDEIALELGLTTRNDGFEILRRDGFPFYIYSHDNCFFSIESASNNLLTKITHAILQQHSYYFGKEIQWSEVESQIVEIIRKNQDIEIQSEPKKRYVWIPQVENNKNLFWKSFRKGTIVINENKAVFRE